MSAAVAAAFWLLVVVLVVRSYLALRSGGSTAFLNAIAAGVFGLFFLGAIVDDAVIDSALGGKNLVHLLRNLLVTCAVWFVREGVFRAGPCRDRSKASRHPAVLVLALSVITGAFCLQEFMPTTGTYIPDAVHQPSVFVYATVYMGFLAALAISVVRVCAEPQESRPVRVSARVIAAGMSLIAAASVDEIIYMTTRFAGAHGAVVDVAYALFKPLFYFGVLLVSLGLAVPPAVRLWRRLSIRERLALFYLYVSASETSPKARAMTAFREAISYRPSLRLYEAVVREEDRRVQHPGVATSRRADAALRFAQGSFKEVLNVDSIRG